MAKSPQKKKPSPRINSTEASGFSFEATDFEGRIVYLPPGRWEWKIISVHPDLCGYENAVKTTAIDPQIVVFEEDIENIEIHVTYDLGQGKHSNKYLWVPIRYTGDVGKVITAYWLPELKPNISRIKWRKN
jgi:hypothetical protein